MKKFSMLLLILICLSFNMIRATPALAVNVFKEGVYKAADFNFSPNSLYSVQNVSSKDSVFILIFDQNQLGIQSIRLDPNSGRYNLLPLQPQYRLIIVGSGEVFIS